MEVFALETLLDEILWPNSCAPPWLLNILMFFIIRVVQDRDVFGAWD